MFNPYFRAVVCLFILFGLQGCTLKGKGTTEGNNGAVKESEVSNRREEVLNDAIVLGYRINNSSFPSDLSLQSVTGEMKSIKDIFNGKKLVLQTSELGCNVCIDSALLVLNKASALIGTQNVLLLAHANNIRYLINYARLNKQNSDQVFMISTRQVDSCYIHQTNSPFFYITDESLKISEVYFPLKENPKLSEQYIQVMVEKYFGKSQAK